MQTHFYFLSTEVNKYLCETDIITIKTIVRPSLLQTKWYFPFTSPIPSTADTSRAQQKRLSCLLRACRAEDRGLVPVENFYQRWHVSLTLMKTYEHPSTQHGFKYLECHVFDFYLTPTEQRVRHRGWISKVIKALALKNCTVFRLRETHGLLLSHA